MKIKKIQLDNPDFEALDYSLKNIGAFEVVGEAIKNLNIITNSSIEDTKQLLSMSIETLRQFEMIDYHGFHDVIRNSKNKSEIVNQIAFHIRAGQKRLVINDFDFDNLYLYFEKSLNILNSIYSIIATNFITNSRISTLGADLQSVLTIRRYFANHRHQKNIVGIPSHCDYGLLTLITSDINGLEVKINNTYCKCNFFPNYRYYVIIGDWLKFQLGDKFKSGEHYVPNLPQERHSLSVFLNPPFGEKLEAQSSMKNEKLKNKLNSKLSTSLY